MIYLYIVLASEQGEGQMVYGLFNTLIAAQQFVASNPKLGGRTQFERVQGSYQPPAKVFAAHRYLPRTDTFDFVGLYSDLDEADAASGEPSRAIPYEPQ